MPGSHSVTFLITNLGFGGAERQLAYLACALARRGWQVEVITMIDVYAHGDALAQAGVPVMRLKMPRGVADPRAPLKLLARLRRSKPELLVTFAYHANLLGRLMARPGGVRRVVASIRNENFGGPRRDRLLRLTDGLCDITTINSERAARAVVARGVVPADKLRVMPNAIVAEDYRAPAGARAAFRQELGLADNEWVWLAVGRLEPQKDYPTLFAALARLEAGRLLVAGVGQRGEELERRVAQLGLRERVRFLGQRPDMPRMLAGADALVLSSAWEGLPNVVMEALAARTPVVSTDVGGVRELVEDGVSGLLVPPGDPEALAAAMRRMMELPDAARQRMREAGEKHILASFDLDRVVDAWEELFLSLLARPAPASRLRPSGG